MVAFNGRILFDSVEFTTGKATVERSVADPVVLEMLKSEESTSRTTMLNKEEVTQIVVPLLEPSGGNISSL